MGNSEAPVCVAVVICNDVIEDKRTNNKSLIGLFNAIHTPSLPTVHPKMAVLVSITNATGETPISLVLRAPSGREIMRAEGSFNTPDPLTVIDIVFEINGLPVEEIGTHMVDVHCNNQYIGGRRFQVMGQWLNQNPA